MSLDASPPPLLPKAGHPSASVRHLFAILLSLCLGLFLADAVVSLVDDSLILCFNLHLLTWIRGVLALFATLIVVGVYCLMGLTPMIPKRLFLPLTLFIPVAGLVVVPLLIYYYSRLQLIAWAISCGQVILGVFILRWAQGGWRLRWPLIAADRLEGRSFSWRTLSVFLIVNLFVLLPAVVVYLFVCAGLAVHHFSDGFLALRREGLMIQARTYVRNDGKTIQLFAMSHVGEPGFYSKLSQSFPTNSLVLMEGVTDSRRLLTNTITYKRMAASLGVAEQQVAFKPRGELVRADVDVEVFTTNTIQLLNLVMLVHANGLNPETALQLMQYSPPDSGEQLFEDLLTKRNRHLLKEIHARLSQSEHLIVPWGAAHMPEIAAGIQQSGFRAVETQEHLAIGFGSAGNKRNPAGKSGDAGKSN